MIIVFAEQVFAEIVGRIAPHGMDVIGVVLRVVEFDQKRRAVQAVIMGLPRLQAAGPCETDVLEPRRRDLGQILIGQFGPQAIRIGSISTRSFIVASAR